MSTIAVAHLLNFLFSTISNVVSENFAPDVAYHVHIICLLADFTSGGGGKGGGVITSQQGSQMGLWQLFQFILAATKTTIFHRKSDHLH